MEAERRLPIRLRDLLACDLSIDEYDRLKKWFAARGVYASYCRPLKQWHFIAKGRKGGPKYAFVWCGLFEFVERLKAPAETLRALIEQGGIVTPE